MSNQSFQKINDFFESYADAFESFDTKLMTRHFHIPCMLMSDDTSTIFQEASKLEGLFNQGTAFYKQYGVANVRPNVWSKRMWTERICKVKVNWQYFDKENKPLYQCDYQYILRLAKQREWKIEVSVSVNEKQKMDEWLHLKNAAPTTATGSIK